MNLDCFEEDLQAYLVDMDIQGLSQHTIRARESVLRLFPRWIMENGKRVPSCDDGDGWLRLFKEFLYYKKRIQGLSDSYIANLVISQKVFNRFTRADWCECMPTPKKKKALPKIVTEEEYAMMVEATMEIQPRSSSAKYHKTLDLLIIQLLYHTGLRVSELTGLRWRDVDFNERTIRVVDGKGGKDRTVLFNKTVDEALHEYMEYFHEMNGEDYVVQINNTSKKGVTGRTVQVRIKNIRQRAGIKKNITPHMFRHSYATNLVRAGMNLRAVQMLMGHSSLSTTQIYLNISLEDIRREYEKIQEEIL